MPVTDHEQKRYKTQPAPMCPIHGILMFTASVKDSIRYFRCPIGGCNQRRKQVRHDKTF